MYIEETDRHFLHLVLCNTTCFDYFLTFERAAALESFKKETVQEWMSWIYAKAFSNYADHYASPAHPSTCAKTQ